MALTHCTEVLHSSLFGAANSAGSLRDVADLAAMAVPINLAAAPGGFEDRKEEAEEWFNKLKGKHRIVFDVTQPHEIFPFAWPKVFLMTNSIFSKTCIMCRVFLVLTRYVYLYEPIHIFFIIMHGLHYFRRCNVIIYRLAKSLVID